MSTNLFIIDGASGTGKSDLLEFVNTSMENCGVLMKSTTRVIRSYERNKEVFLDLNFITDHEFDTVEFDYMYRYGGFKYGFKRNDLDNFIEMYHNVFLIIRSIDIIESVTIDYDKLNVIKVFVYSDMEEIKKRLKKQNYYKQQIEFRLSRIKATYKDYSANRDFYDHLIINNSDRHAYRSLITRLVKMYN